MNQAVATASPLSDLLCPDFLVWYLLAPATQNNIHAGKVETARPNISLADLRNLELPLPPLSEQERVVATLEAYDIEYDRLRSMQEAVAADLDALLPSILDRAFKGEL